MKDYYYILGLKPSATKDEIVKAYRKLSFKFHPDTNFGDEFFTDRFKEILEAYEVLNNSLTREEYDRKRRSNSANSTHSSTGNNFSPVIEFFKCDKSSFEYGEAITFSWRTINADKVSLSPFGIVSPIGSKTYRIKDFRNKFLNFKIIAENSLIEKQATSTLALNSETYAQLKQYFTKELEKEKEASQQKYHGPSTPDLPSNNLGQTTILIIGIVFAIVAIWLLNIIMG